MRPALSLLIFFAFCLVVSSAGADDHLTFITVGDWGGYGLGGEPADNVLATAKAMADIAAQNGVTFIINVGDNFYEYGVADVNDPQWDGDWKNIFTASSLQVPWYSVLGNHDYAGNPQVQVNYPNSPLWVMPGRSFVQRIWNPSAGENITFVFWDSNPCVSAWRSDDPSGWKPNTTTFHDNIVAEECQVTWLTQALESATDRWVILVTHVSSWEIDMVDLPTLCDTYGVSVVLVGHKHRLEHYTTKHTDADWFISGAGSMVKNDDVDDQSDTNPSKLGEDPDVKWSQKITGFSTHRFTHPGNHLETTFYAARSMEAVHTVTSTPQRDSVSKKPLPRKNRADKN